METTLHSFTDLPKAPDVVCFSHLRWDFIHERPQHILGRFANYARIFYIEEPVVGDFGKGFLDVTVKDKNLWIIVPSLPKNLSEKDSNRLQRELLEVFFQVCNLKNYIFWYYRPSALEFSMKFKPLAVIYDCVDAQHTLKAWKSEENLFKKADLVFTSGMSLYEAKRKLHAEVYPFPNSIDVEFFAQSRKLLTQPFDQEKISGPRIGFFGIIDERIDTKLLKFIAESHPEWQIVMIGPIKRVERSLPKCPNIHYLGRKPYKELPYYLSGWNAALVPYVVNESTEFINPQKIPEYLAAGKFVISTPVKDVVRPYGEMGLVNVADDPAAFVAEIEKVLLVKDRSKWLSEVDIYLSLNSWNKTWEAMGGLIAGKIRNRISVKEPGRRIRILNDLRDYENLSSLPD